VVSLRNHSQPDTLCLMTTLTNRLYPNAVLAAAWWADQLRSDESVTCDVGAPGGEAFRSTEARLIVANRGRQHRAFLTCEQIDAFQSVLAEIVDVDMRYWEANKDTYPGRVTILSVDYEAEGMLLRALREADIEGALRALGVTSPGLFSGKTTMWVSPDEILVRMGSNTPEFVIASGATAI
jgi:hypothetical protein